MMTELVSISCLLPSEQDNVEQAKVNPAHNSSISIPPFPLMSLSIIIEFHKQLGVTIKFSLG